jgi:hypothetical protein
MSDAPENMIAAIPEGAVFMHHKTGSTWNDGGSWHSVFFRKSDGSGGVINMESDYASDNLKVSDWDIPKYLNPTAAQIAADPRVQALVNAVSAVSLKAYGYDRFYETTFHRNVHETLSAALAAFKEVKE